MTHHIFFWIFNLEDTDDRLWLQHHLLHTRNGEVHTGRVAYLHAALQFISLLTLGTQILTDKYHTQYISPERVLRIHCRQEQRPTPVPGHIYWGSYIPADIGLGTLLYLSAWHSGGWWREQNKRKRFSFKGVGLERCGGRNRQWGGVAGRKYGSTQFSWTSVLSRVGTASISTTLFSCS